MVIAAAVGDLLSDIKLSATSLVDLQARLCGLHASGLTRGVMASSQELLEHASAEPMEEDQDEPPASINVCKAALALAMLRDNAVVEQIGQQAEMTGGAGSLDSHSSAFTRWVGRARPQQPSPAASESDEVAAVCTDSAPVALLPPQQSRSAPRCPSYIRTRALKPVPGSSSPVTHTIDPSASSPPILQSVPVLDSRPFILPAHSPIDLTPVPPSPFLTLDASSLPDVPAHTSPAALDQWGAGLGFGGADPQQGPTVVLRMSDGSGCFWTPPSTNPSVSSPFNRQPPTDKQLARGRGAGGPPTSMGRPSKRLKPVLVHNPTPPPPTATAHGPHADPHAAEGLEVIAAMANAAVRESAQVLTVNPFAAPTTQTPDTCKPAPLPWQGQQAGGAVVEGSGHFSPTTPSTSPSSWGPYESEQQPAQKWPPVHPPPLTIPLRQHNPIGSEGKWPPLPPPHHTLPACHSQAPLGCEGADHKTTQAWEVGGQIRTPRRSASCKEPLSSLSAGAPPPLQARRGRRVQRSASARVPGSLETGDAAEHPAQPQQAVGERAARTLSCTAELCRVLLAKAAHVQGLELREASAAASAAAARDSAVPTVAEQLPVAAPNAEGSPPPPIVAVKAEPVDQLEAEERDEAVDQKILAVLFSLSALRKQVGCSAATGGPHQANPRKEELSAKMAQLQGLCNNPGAAAKAMALLRKAGGSLKTQSSALGLSP